MRIDGRNDRARPRDSEGRPRGLAGLTAAGLATALVGLLATGAAGCRRDGGVLDKEVAEQAVESAGQTSAEGALLVTLLDGVDPSLSPQDMAAAAAASATAMQPPDCATVQSNLTHVTWTFSSCTGVFGLITLDGSVTLTFRAGLRGTTIELASSDLEVSGVPVTLGGTAVYSQTGTTYSLEVDTSASADTARFGGLSRTGNYTVTWEEGGTCLQVDGTWSTGIGARSWTTTATAYTVCEGACPVGTVTFARADESYVVSFLAGGDVQWSTSGGQSGQIQLTCP